MDSGVRLIVHRISIAKNAECALKSNKILRNCLDAMLNVVRQHSTSCAASGGSWGASNEGSASDRTAQPAQGPRHVSESSEPCDQDPLQ